MPKIPTAISSKPFTRKLSPVSGNSAAPEAVDVVVAGRIVVVVAERAAVVVGPAVRVVGPAVVGGASDWPGTVVVAAGAGVVVVVGAVVVVVVVRGGAPARVESESSRLRTTAATTPATSSMAMAANRPMRSVVVSSVPSPRQARVHQVPRKR